MAEDQRNARIFGVLFMITFLTSIPALALFQPVLDDPASGAMLRSSRPAHADDRVAPTIATWRTTRSSRAGSAS
jgi:hypothetical protein